MNPPSALSSALRSRFARTTVAIGLACASLLTLTHIVHADAQKTAAEYGVPYHKRVSLMEAVSAHYRLLKHFGRPHKAKYAQ